MQSQKNKLPVILREFSAADFAAYQAWFANDIINKELGPMDENDEWLQYVLSHQSIHRQYAATTDNELVAVAGVDLADSEHQFHYITDFCVNPLYWQQGIGRQVLAKLLVVPQLQYCQNWALGIAADNRAAQAFFMKQGFRPKSISDNADLIEYALKLSGD